jgi:hypothetical protein
MTAAEYETPDAEENHNLTPVDFDGILRVCPGQALWVLPSPVSVGCARIPCVPCLPKSQIALNKNKTRFTTMVVVPILPALAKLGLSFYSGCLQWQFLQT